MTVEILYPVDRTKAIVTQPWADHTRGNRGEDWGSYGGANIPLYAQNAGIVITAGWDTTGYGWSVVIDHGGYRTRHAHCIYLIQRVKAGDEVQAGQIVAVMGSTGNSTGVHDHNELWIGKRNVDPQKYYVDKLSGTSPVLDPDDVFTVPDGMMTARPQLVNLLTTQRLRIRDKPTTRGRTMGWLPPGAREIPVHKALQSGADVWLWIGHNQYIAAYYRGEVYVEWMT